MSFRKTMRWLDRNLPADFELFLALLPSKHLLNALDEYSEKITIHTASHGQVLSVIVSCRALRESAHEVVRRIYGWSLPNKGAALAVRSKDAERVPEHTEWTKVAPYHQDALALRDCAPIMRNAFDEMILYSYEEGRGSLQGYDLLQSLYVSPEEAGWNPMKDPEPPPGYW